MTYRTDSSLIRHCWETSYSKKANVNLPHFQEFFYFQIHPLFLKYTFWTFKSEHQQKQLFNTALKYTSEPSRVTDITLSIHSIVKGLKPQTSASSEFYCLAPGLPHPVWLRHLSFVPDVKSCLSLRPSLPLTPPLPNKHNLLLLISHGLGCQITKVFYLLTFNHYLLNLNASITQLDSHFKPVWIPSASYSALDRRAVQSMIVHDKFLKAFSPSRMHGLYDSCFHHLAFLLTSTFPAVFWMVVQDRSLGIYCTSISW